MAFINYKVGFRARSRGEELYKKKKKKKKKKIYIVTLPGGRVPFVQNFNGKVDFPGKSLINVYFYEYAYSVLSTPGCTLIH